MPEGVVIYKIGSKNQTQRIRYVNKTFMKMFPVNNENVSETDNEIVNNSFNNVNKDDLEEKQ